MSADAGFVQPAVKMHLNARIPGPTCRPFVLDGSAQRLRTCGDQLSGCPHFSAPKATMMLLALPFTAQEFEGVQRLRTPRRSKVASQRKWPVARRGCATAAHSGTVANTMTSAACRGILLMAKGLAHEVPRIQDTLGRSARYDRRNCGPWSNEGVQCVLPMEKIKSEAV